MTRPARAHPVLFVLGVALAVFAARALEGQEVSRRSARSAAAAPIAARAIARGAVLTADDITYPDSRSASDSTVSPGWVTRRVVAAGEPLRPPAVQPPIVVTANQPVELEWTDGVVRITVRGTATRNASAGERITVRTETGRRVDGVVLGAGRVRIQ
jgi:flagella basal body P-ring formation protein FlgA